MGLQTETELTTEQQRVASALPTDRILVTAGPGTGKTYLLVARLVELVRRFELSPGQEILVLSFSRAAVREIRQRVAEGDKAARYTRAYTFDSFATRLLSEFDPEGTWQREGYDGRILCATRLLREHDEAREYIRMYLHILIDEVQDLVGVRAEFVKALLEESSGGFTLFGDPAQGIYDFSVQGEPRRRGCAALYDWIRYRFGQSLHEYSLTENKRAQTEAATAALAFGSMITSPKPDFRAIMDGLTDLILRLPSLGKLDEAAPFLVKPGNSTAILCRTNGQALLVSRKLWEFGLPHILQRSSSDRIVPPWVAAVLGGLPARAVGKTTFLRRMEDLDIDGPTPTAAWNLLRKLDRAGASDALDLGVIASRISLGNIPEELVDNPCCDLVVSTIHRAKGLEFDRVVIAGECAIDTDEEEMLAEETRVLYVALTRPKRKLMQIVAPKTSGLHLWTDVDRWVRRYETWHVVDVEVRGRDVHSDDPAGGFMLSGHNVPQLQAYIQQFVRPGDPVELELLHESVSGFRCAYYAVRHQNQIVGVTSESFSATLYRILSKARRHVKWPTGIEQLHVEAIDTVAGTDAAGLRCGLGPSGIWFHVRVSGLGRLRFLKADRNVEEES